MALFYKYTFTVEEDGPVAGEKVIVKEIFYGVSKTDAKHQFQEKYGYEYQGDPLANREVW